MHDFRERLSYSENAYHEPYWDAAYRKFFPNMVNHMPTQGDTASQRMGVDRVIFLDNGRTVYIDEKLREEEYTDILLEFVSQDRTNAPGWIEKDLAIDYIAYMFAPSSRCYLFPWPLLRRAWQLYGEGWKEQYQIVRARNNGYSTLSVAVPILELRKAITYADVVLVTQDDMGDNAPLPEDRPVKVTDAKLERVRAGGSVLG